MPRQYSYLRVRVPGHPKATSAGDVYKHILVAEAALGRPLPKGAQVHHVDGNTRNNANTNLVICEDLAYHKLLEHRGRVVRLGGDPDHQKWCGSCSMLRPLCDFNRSSANRNSGLQSICRQCSRAAFKSWWHSRRVGVA
jgi:hypothetical protein